MPTVSIAPSIWKKLWKITVKESRRDEVFGTHLMACTQHDLLLGSSTHLYERSGRFWESESDAEYEDRGTVKDRSRGESRVVWRAAAVSTVAERPQPLSVSTFRAATSNIGASSPSTRPTRAPWTKLWKGPLPPRRVSPARTFGDFISCRPWMPLQANKVAIRFLWAFESRRARTVLRDLDQ